MSDLKDIILATLTNHLRQVTTFSIDVNTDFDVEEWALTLDDIQGFIAANIKSTLTLRQTASLDALDSYLSAIGGESNADIWTLKAFCQIQEWGDIRTLVSIVLDAFRSPESPQ